MRSSLRKVLAWLVITTAVLAAGLALVWFVLLPPWVRVPGFGAVARRAFRRPGDPPPELWTLPPFRAHDQQNQEHTERDLSGRIWIADFIYTTCTSACPTMTAHMVLLARKLANTDVRFVSFSIDPARDTPDVLRRYASTWKADPSRWWFLQTDQNSLRPLLAGMKTSVERSADNDITHSDHFFLIDANGQVRGLYDPAVASELSDLATDATMLAAAAGHGLDFARSPTNERTDLETKGGFLYDTLGCAGCHDLPAVAPSLTGLWASTVVVESGQTITADDAYLREAILNPQTAIVRGFLPLMPNYQDHLHEGDLDALVAFIRTLRPASVRKAETPEAPIVSDPVCGMKVRVAAGTPSADLAGQSFHFCSEACRARFVANPTRFSR